MRTRQQQAGDAAEDLVAERLVAAGWQIVARRLRVGRDELDIVATDPGPPPCLVVIEVRWRRDRGFGLPEETLDWRKRARLRRASGLLLDGRLAGRQPSPSLPLRVDLVAVEPSPVGGQLRLRHHRHVLRG